MKKQTQGSYAEPSLRGGNIELRFHWDRSNGFIQSVLQRGAAGAAGKPLGNTLERKTHFTVADCCGDGPLVLSIVRVGPGIPGGTPFKMAWCFALLGTMRVVLLGSLSLGWRWVGVW